MSDHLSKPCTAFVGTRRLVSGPLVDVALAIKAAEKTDVSEAILTFDDASGAVIDLDLRGTTAEIITRLAEQDVAAAQTARPVRLEESVAQEKKRGRPKLGVIAREVTLLPRHWEWLAAQRGGASQALRRLVDEARRADGGQTAEKVARERTYRFLSALAGDLPGFEEANRALFSGNGDAFTNSMAEWPSDVRDHAILLALTDPPKGDS